MACVGGTTLKFSACFARSDICTPTLKIVAPPLTTAVVFSELHDQLASLERHV